MKQKFGIQEFEGVCEIGVACDIGGVDVLDLDSSTPLVQNYPIRGRTLSRPPMFVRYHYIIAESSSREFYGTPPPLERFVGPTPRSQNYR